MYFTICHYVSCRLKEIADASMQAAESHCWCNSSASRNNGGMAEWCIEWRNGQMAEWSNGMNGGRMAEWRNGGMADRMAEWQKEWQNGRMVRMATYVLFMVHTDTDTDTDTTLIIYSILLIFYICTYLFCCFARGTKATGGATYISPLLTKSQNKYKCRRTSRGNSIGTMTTTAR